jgi:hypothetical protein
MPIQCELIIIPKNKSEKLDFGKVFHDCLNAFETIGAYSNLTVKSEKFITRDIALSFCQTVAGTMYGNYSLYAPTFVNQNDYIRRSPFFHFSTLADENINQAETALSLQLDCDDHAVSFLFQMAICLIPYEYRIYFAPSTSSKQYSEITKESIASQSFDAQETKQ